MHYLRLLAILLVVSFLTSCDNELDLAAPWKDIPVVYGMLSPSDTAQYIRVERAFLDPNHSAFSFTQNPDSIYYEHATVQILNLESGAEYTLEKVDANLEGFVRDTGIWADSPNYLYKIKTEEIALVEGNQYQLVINKGDNLPVTKVTTQLVGTPKFVRPLSTQAISFLGSKYKIIWTKSDGAELYDINLIFHYKENTESDPNQFNDKSLSWKVLSGINPPSTSNGNKTKSFKSNRFFSWIKATIPETDLKRKFVAIDIVIVAGGKEIQKYFDISAANVGLTGSETSSEYSNIPEGRGIFSNFSKAIQEGLLLTDSTLDTLKHGHLTGKLNFIN